MTRRRNSEYGFRRSSEYPASEGGNGRGLWQEVSASREDHTADSANSAAVSSFEAFRTPPSVHPPRIAGVRKPLAI
jgi:hypothetical protein